MEWLGKRGSQELSLMLKLPIIIGMSLILASVSLKYFKRDIPMIKNVFTKRKTKRENSNVDVSDNSWQVLRICWISRKCNPIRMIGNIYQFLPFFVRTRNSSYDWPRQLLNEYDVEIYLCFQNNVSKQVVFPDILRKNIEIPYNHICTLLTAKQIDLALLFLISWYFLMCHSLLKQCF